MLLNLDLEKSAKIAKSFQIEFDENTITLEQLHSLLEPFLEKIKEGKIDDNPFDRIPDEVFLTLSKDVSGPSILSNAPFVKQYQAKYERKAPDLGSVGFGGGELMVLSSFVEAYENLSRTEEKSQFVRRIEFPKVSTKFRREREELNSIQTIPATSEAIMRPPIQDRGFIAVIDQIQLEKLRAGRAKGGTYNSDEVKNIARQFNISTKGTKAAVVGKLFNLIQEWRESGDL